ncbi:uncharacterized protein LOC144708787 [Wolffia australiana]
MGVNAAAATVFIAATLAVSAAFLPPSPPSSEPIKLQTTVGFYVLDKTQGSAKRHVHNLPQPPAQHMMTYSGGAGGGGLAAETPAQPLTWTKRQVPTGADPIHHNRRPPSFRRRQSP